MWCVDALRLLVDAIKRTNDIVADQAKVVGSGPTFSHESVRVASLPLAQISCLLERDKMLHSRLLGVLPECRDLANMGIGWQEDI